jgi:hypothetical protein
MILLGAILSGCGLNRWLPLEPGVYMPTSNATTAGSIESLEVERGNHLATFHSADGATTVVSFSSRDKLDWPTGCPANIGSTYMEVLDIADKPLTIAGLTFEDPILVRDCPSDPEHIVLREDGLVGGGGGACAGLDKCFIFGRQPSTTLLLTRPIINAKPLPSSMKGYELYSWTGEGDESWHYTLVTGTNRLKTIEEITAAENQVTQGDWVKITVTGTEELKTLLERLEPGTELSWRGQDWLESQQQATTNVLLPNSNLVEEIKNHCHQLEIQLRVSQ